MTWPENPAFVLIARNKAPWVGECVRSMLGQTYCPITFVFSDQSSTDGTAEIIAQEVSKYEGPNKTILLKCPVTERKGMYGLIDHINWLHKKLLEMGFDYILQMSADDIAGIDRCKRTMEVLGELDAAGKRPLFFGTAQRFAETKDLPTINEESDEVRTSAWPPESQWVTALEHLGNRVGGSSSNAWDPKLIEAIYPLPLFALVDVYLPFIAALMDSFYFLREMHHIYVERADPDNTGLQGRRMMAQNDLERTRWNELIRFQLLANNVLMLNKIDEMRENPEMRDDPKLKEIQSFLIGDQILGQAIGWFQDRATLTLGRVPPMAMPI